MASLADAGEALRSTNAKANFQRLTRLLMCGGLRLLRETFDTIHKPADLPLKLRDPTIQGQLRGARLSRPEWNCLYPSPGVYGKSTDCDITLLFRLLRTVCNLTSPPGPRGWDNLPNSSDVSLEADLVRIKYYRNEVYGHKKTMEISDVEFVRLWNEISEALLRIAATISHTKRDEWKTSIDKYLSDPLTPEEERCNEELNRWYMNDMDVKAGVQGLREDAKADVEKLDATVKEEVKTLKEDVKRGHESIQEEVRRLREEVRQSPAPMYITGPVHVIQMHIVNTVESIQVTQTGLPIFLNHPSGSPQLPQTVGFERSCAIPIHPDQEQPVGAEGYSGELQLNQQNPPDEIHIWDVILSFKESFLLFAKYLRYKLNLDVRRHDLGSFLITVECSSLQILEGLWEDYRSGHFNQIAQEVLITADVLEKLGLTSVKLKTFILEEEYHRGKQIFMDNSALSVKHMYSYLLHGKAADGSKSTVEAQDTVLKTVLGQLATSLTKEEKDSDDGHPKEKQSREAEKQPIRERDGSTLTSFVQNGVSCMWNYLIKCSPGLRRTALAPWLMILLLCSCFTILDPRSYKDGCPTEDTSVPFETKDINMSDYLNTARAENFMGRQWLYRDVENTFIDSEISGVLIIGDPGAGKSALSSQLICSRTSSSVIHAHILGYHLCKYSDKNTQMAGTFVRNVAEMIARRLPEYGYVVSNSSYIQRSFVLDCIQNQDPVGCFEQTVLTPLRNLKNKPKENWYIVIDALDECLARGETGHSIVYLLNNKIPLFPSWLKLIMTSRNESDALLYSSKIKELIIDPEDSRNLKDIELFLTSRFYQGGLLLNRIRLWFGDDSVESTSKLVSTLLSKSQGNFLFVKEVLHDWELSKHELGDAYALPKTLGDLYHSYFERLYPDSKKESFIPARRVLELLVATFEPLTQEEILDVLKMKERNLEEEYEFKSRLNELGHFLRYGENNTVTLYHLSLNEWLASDSNRKFHVSKKTGHETFCDYYFSLIRDGDKSTLLKHVVTLAKHIAWKEAYVEEFLHFPSQTVNSIDPQSNRTLLHLAATINSTDVLELVLRHFSFVDCVDNRGITPAFLAAEHGLVDNLVLLVKKGANVNRKTSSIIAMYKEDVRAALQQANDGFGEFNIPDLHVHMLVFQSKSRLFNATLLHAAAQGGHANVVDFLLDNNASISTFDGAHQTALQLAAENGHVEVVKALYKAGAHVDQTALHHAAANNRLEVVKFLLEIGVKDTCLRCDGSFYWLKTKHRFQSKFKTVKIPVKENCFSYNVFNHSLAKLCIDLERNWEELGDVTFGELFNDEHLILCHTALHAAVASGHEKVVSCLISEETNALNCYDYTGRTPLHEAVRKNEAKLVVILLEKQSQKIHYECNHWQNVGTQIEQDDLLLSYMVSIEESIDYLSIEESIDYHKDICHCGYTPLHLAARYGHEDLGIFLISRGAHVDARDCSGATPFHVAACHNQRGFVEIFSDWKFKGDINSKTLNGSTPLHSAAACGAVDVIDDLFYYQANCTAVDIHGMTPLHYSILNVKSSQRDQNVFQDESSWINRLVSEMENHPDADYFDWLDTFRILVLSGCEIDAVDTSGRTALHIAAHNGLAGAVNILLQRNATLEKRDKQGKTPLEVAIENATIVPKDSPFMLANEIDELSDYIYDHEMVVYLLLWHGASFKRCERSGSSLLHRAIVNQQPYIVQLLLLTGASLTCKDSLGRAPLVTYLQNGGDWIDVVLKHFNVPVAIKCGKPFNVSVFHLLSYHTPTLTEDNFFEERKCDKGDECDHSESELRKGPLVEVIESHPLKLIIKISCLDAEGFTPLHRAAQGANLVAIRYLLANGANDSILSPHGYDALSLAVLHAGSNLWRLYGLLDANEQVLKITEASDAAFELLRHAVKTRGYRIRCDSSKPELTLYHLAASRGLVKFIDELFKDRKPHQLDVNCPNMDGITPMYLAKLFGNRVIKGIYNPWEHVVSIIKSHGGKMRYPSKDAEYNLIYNRIHGWIPTDFTLDLRPDIRHFVTSLLLLYEKRKYGSFHCRADGLTLEPKMMTELIFNEIERIGDFLQGRKWCLCQHRQFKRYFLRSLAHKSIIPLKTWNKVQLNNWMQRELLILMLMRHKEIFGSFACVKSLFRRFRSLLQDGKRMERFIRVYEETPPLSVYLNVICDDFHGIFRNYLLHHARRLTYDTAILAGYFFKYPDFVSERQTSIGSYTTLSGDAVQLMEWPLSWPLEFLVKLSFGFFRRYDYVKTLQVGLEHRTYVPLYNDETRQALSRIEMKDVLKYIISRIHIRDGKPS